MSIHILEFAQYAEGWRWSLTSTRNEPLIISKPFVERRRADENASNVLGPHERRPKGTDGNGFEVHR